MVQTPYGCMVVTIFFVSLIAVKKIPSRKRASTILEANIKFFTMIE